MSIPSKQDVERLMNLLDNNRYLSHPHQAQSLRKEAEMADRDMAIRERFEHEKFQD